VGIVPGKSEHWGGDGVDAGVSALASKEKVSRKEGNDLHANRQLYLTPKNRSSRVEWSAIKYIKKGNCRE